MLEIIENDIYYRQDIPRNYIRNLIFESTQNSTSEHLQISTFNNI